jgi:hypothetical protein
VILVPNPVIIFLSKGEVGVALCGFFVILTSSYEKVDRESTTSWEIF